jgi:hypothetical protein
VAFHIEDRQPREAKSTRIGVATALFVAFEIAATRHPAD